MIPGSKPERKYDKRKEKGDEGISWKLRKYKIKYGNMIKSGKYDSWK